MTERDDWMNDLLDPPLEHEERGRRFVEQISQLDVTGYLLASLDDFEEGLRRSSEEIKNNEPKTAESLKQLADSLSNRAKIKTSVSIDYFQFPSQQLLDEVKQKVQELAHQYGGEKHKPSDLALKLQESLDQADRQFQQDRGTFYSSLSTWSDSESYNFY